MRLQEEACAVVNDAKKTLTLTLLPFFLAANHIWDSRYRLPGISDDDYDAIQDALRIPVVRLNQKLPERILPFEHLKNEDTHAHSVLDALLTFVFPTYHHRYELHWANRPAAGSGDRRDGDAHIKDGFELRYMELSFRAGMYLWQVVHTSYLPRDQYDIGNVVACVELLKTFKAIMDEIETERYVRTPTQFVENDEELPDLYRPRPTNITPSK
ncbi:hypothetical protein BGZ81_010786 [Podila clonocystis]|nr:hypothetical protein BGZ81_010786 [Podila clonocystis]